jgi:hypothetical protein
MTVSWADYRQGYPSCNSFFSKKFYSQFIPTLINMLVILTTNHFFQISIFNVSMNIFSNDRILKLTSTFVFFFFEMCKAHRHDLRVLHFHILSKSSIML